MSQYKVKVLMTASNHGLATTAIDKTITADDVELEGESIVFYDKPDAQSTNRECTKVAFYPARFTIVEKIS